MHTLLDHRKNLAQVGFDRRRRKSIANAELNVDILLAFLVDDTFGIVIEQTSQVGAQQIFLFAAGDFGLHCEEIEFIQ